MIIRIPSSAALTLAVAATVTAVLAAIAGIRTVWVETGGEIDARKPATNVLELDPEGERQRDPLEVSHSDGVVSSS